MNTAQLHRLRLTTRAGFDNEIVPLHFYDGKTKLNSKSRHNMKYVWEKIELTKKYVRALQNYLRPLLTFVLLDLC